MRGGRVVENEGQMYDAYEGFVAMAVTEKQG
jgi:hypothetical protein